MADSSLLITIGIPVVLVILGIALGYLYQKRRQTFQWEVDLPGKKPQAGTSHAVNPSDLLDILEKAYPGYLVIKVYRGGALAARRWAESSGKAYRD